MSRSRVLEEALMIYDETGHRLWLGSEEIAHAAIANNYGEDPGTVKFEGWVTDVGWDRCSYERKRDFVGETGLTGWWEGCRGPAGGVETRKLRRAWRFEYAASSEGEQHA
jgi:hypothetical protein